MNEGLVIYDFIIECLSWQIAQNLIRRRVAASHLGLRCFICSLFECIQPVPHVHTLNFRLAMPLLVARKPVCCIYYIELSHIHVARFAINSFRMRIEKR